MAMNYTEMWEAFVGGWAGTSPLTKSGMEKDPYTERVEQFYSDIVGPAFGYTGEEGFGEAYSGRISIGGEREALDLAEREFRLAIGDPYGTDDPFAWETLSRYATGEGPVTEAQQLLEGELFDKGGLLGGETGSAYGLSMEGQAEAYTTGMAGQREALSSGALTAGVGLASGTSGATLRSGAALGQAEDVLSEAYKESKGLGMAYVLGKEKTEGELSKDLQEAFDIYTDAIRDEKQDFLAGVMADVQRISLTYGGSFGEEKDIAGDWGGLTYDEDAVPGFREDGACGIGYLWDGTACVPIEGLKPNVYGELTGTGEGFESLYDCTGVFGGNAEVDDCGVCEGDNSTCLEEGCGPGAGPPSVECEFGEIVCDASECPSIDVDPEGDVYVNCAEEYGDAFEWDPILGTCVDMGTGGGAQFGTGSCHQPYNDCDPGTCCCDNGLCSETCCDWYQWDTTDTTDPSGTGTGGGKRTGSSSGGRGRGTR